MLRSSAYRCVALLFLATAVGVAADPKTPEKEPDEIKPPNELLAGGLAGESSEKLVKDGGGNKESEAAVAKGLAWLARQQKKDGTWEFDGKGDNASTDPAAATGMALLPFLAVGHTQMPSKENKHRDTVSAGLSALLAIQKKRGDGRFSDDAYANAIATLALCEAFGLTGDKVQLKKPCQAAVDALQKAQGPNGSWGYKAGDDGDTSILGWQIQALHAAKMCKDLTVDPKALEKAAKFLDSVASGKSKYKYGYTDAGSARPTMSAVGLLCRYYLSGWGPDSAAQKDGAAYLLKEHPPENEKEQEFDIYDYYYATQVMRYRGGDGWAKDWNPKMRDLLVGKQVDDSKKPAVDGSWDKDPTWMGAAGWRLGTTCLAILTLEVYYRHLPLEKKGAKENDGKSCSLVAHRLPFRKTLCREKFEKPPYSPVVL